MPTRPRMVRDSVIIGVTQALTIVAIIAIFLIISGNQQQQALNDLRSSARAQVCELALKVHTTPEGSTRDEGATNSLCLIPNGIEPIDANGDGVVEVENGP